MDRSELHRVVQQALRARALDNRGRLHPAQLNRLGTALADLLLDGSSEAGAHPKQFVEQGLALSSMLAAGTSLQRALFMAGEADEAIKVAEVLARLTVEFQHAEIQVVLRDQEQIRAAVSRVLDAQQAEIEQQRYEAERLTSLVHELSMPIVPVYHGILVLPLVGALDSRRSYEVTDRLLGEIARHSANCVIIDITGVPVVDTAVAQHLLQTIRAAHLLGTMVVLTGIGPEIAQTMVQLGIELGDVTTLRDLEAGITYALRRQNLTIQALKRG